VTREHDLKYEDPNGDIWTQVPFSTMSKQQLIEAIVDYGEFIVALRSDDDGSFTLMDEVRNKRNRDYKRCRDKPVTVG
jgi:hypothetical protein